MRFKNGIKTNEFIRVLKVLRFKYLFISIRQPTDADTLLRTCSKCNWKDKVGSKMTPKYLNWDTSSMVWGPQVTLEHEPGKSLVWEICFAKMMYLVLSKFILKSLSLHQQLRDSKIRLKSFFNFFKSESNK